LIRRRDLRWGAGQKSLGGHEARVRGSRSARASMADVTRQMRRWLDRHVRM